MATEFINGQWRIPNSWDVDESNQGKISNYSMDFDGTSAEIDLGISPVDLVGNSKPYSVSAWVYIAQSDLVSGTNYFIIGAFNPDRWYFRIMNSYVGFGYGNTVSNTSLTQITGDQWNHIVFTFDLTTHTIYINGVSKFTLSSSGQTIASNNAFIGALNGASGPINRFKGKLDQVTVFDYALSQDQVTQLAPYLYAFNFNSSRIRLNSTSILQNVSSFTISAWAKRIGGSNDRMIFGSDQSGNRGLYISARSGGQYKVLLSTNASTNDQFTYSTGGADNVWRNIIVNWNGTSINLFIDGVFVYTQAVVNSTGNFSMPVEPSIGSQNGTTSGFGFIGEISNVQIWDSILTSGGATVGQVAGGEIATIYNNSSPLKGTPPQSSNLKGWWRLDDTATFNSGTTVWSVPDASGNSNTGTSVGMTLSSLVLTSLNGGFIANPMALSPSPIAYYQLGDQDVNFNGGTWTVPNNSLSDYVFDFNGTSDLVNIDSINSSISSSAKGSVSCWVKWDGSNQLKAVGFGSNSVNRQYIIIQILTDGKAYAQYKTFSITGWQLQTTSPITANVWTHFVVVQNGTSPIIYINGSAPSQSFLEATNKTRWWPNLDTFNTSTIGALRWNGGSPVVSYGTGEIGQTTIFDYDLSSSQINTLYNNGVPNDISSLSPTVWYKLNASEIFNSTSTEWSIDNNAYPSVYNSSLDFKGITGTYIQVASTSDFAWGSNGFGVNLWVNFKSVSAAYNILDFRTNGAAAAVGSLWFDPTSGVRWYVAPGYKSANIPASSFSINTWYNIAVVNDGSTIYFYLNGDLIDSTTDTTVYIAAPLTIGAYSGGSNSAAVNGMLSNVSLFNTELTSTQVQTLYNNGTPALDISSLSPVSWWKLNNTTTGIQDSAGSNNGTNNGATEYAGFVNALAGESSGMDSSNLVQSDLQQTSGYSPYSIELNGADQFFTVDNSSKNLNTENISISTWFFQDDSAAASSYPAIIINGFSGSGGGSYWGLVMRPGNIVRAQLRLLDSSSNLTFITEDITQTIVTGQWNHIAMTYDGTTLRGYINGVGETLSLSGASGEIQYSTTGMNSQDLLIGKRGTDSFHLDGKISNFAIWGSGLTSTQIATIYNNGLPNDISSLNPLAWWELGAMTGFNGTDTWTAISNSDSNFAAVSEANMAATDLVNGPGYSDGGIGTSSLVIAKQAPYSFNNALSESMAISNRDDSQASDPYPLIMQLDLTSETSSYTFASPDVSSGATYPYTVDWGDGNIEQITSSGQLVSNRLNHVYDTDTYPRPVVQIGKSTDTGGIKQFYVNNGGSKLQFVDLKQWGQANFTNFVSFRLATKTRITAVDNLKFSGSSLGSLLQQASVANPPSINNWDVSTVTNITSAFLDASSFNQDLNNWDTSSQRSGQSAPGIVMSNVFNGAIAFNGNITNWFTGKLATGSNFLTKAFVFNQDISTKKILAANSPTGVEYVAWDVSNCTTFSQFFYRASAFNQDIGNWNIGGNPSTTAVSCYRMFRSATSFNQDIYTKAISAAASPTGSAYVAWDMSKVNDMEYMFSEGGSTFNGDINNWDTSSVVDMQYMFQQASIFNQDISTKSISSAVSPTGSAYIAWDVSSVLNFQRMFRKAFLFNKNLRSWNLNSSVTNMTNMFETTTAMNGAAYTDTIVGWAVKHNIGTYAPNNINMGTSPTFDNTRTQNTDNDGTTTNYSTLYGTDWPAGWTDALSALNYLEEDAGWTNI